MEESNGVQEADAADKSARENTHAMINIIPIVPDGDIVLDVVFETSRETLRAAKKAVSATPTRPGQVPTQPVTLRTKVQVGYRVQLAVLRRQSKYFDNLLGDTRFQEAKTIEAALKKLSLQNVRPGEADVRDLPLVRITEDDEATRSAGREIVFGDLLRILHGKTGVTKPATMAYVATLAVLADRFDCAGPVSRYLNLGLRFKWPATHLRPARDDSPLPTLSKSAEETLRQKIMVSWLLDQPAKMLAATRELVVYGSTRWTAFAGQEADTDIGSATWWDLQDGLERELELRRECILNTIASVLQHFIRLYTSRTRQCKLGYDSSSSCDSYQLGEAMKFLSGKGLLSFVDFSPGALDALPDPAATDINRLLTTLKQCPSYQIDKNHTNCGFRTRILPIVEYIQSMLSSNVVSISRNEWKKDKDGASWASSHNKNSGAGEHDKTFLFTRSVAGDTRLRYEGAMASDRMARALFTATSWDWTPEQ